MSREELQRLVDTLPEGALETAEKSLQHFKSGPGNRQLRSQESARSIGKSLRFGEGMPNFACDLGREATTMNKHERTP